MCGSGWQGDLFANDLFGVFIGAQAQKDRLPQLVVVCPLGKLDLGDQHGLEPVRPGMWILDIKKGRINRKSCWPES